MYIEYQPIVTVCVCLSRVVHSVIGLTARGPPQAVSFPCSRDGGPGRGGAGTPCPLPLPPRLHGTPGVRPLRCCTPSNSSTRTCTGRTRAWRSVVWTVNSLIALIPQLAHCSHTPTRSLLSYPNSLIPGWKGAREYAQFRGISAVFRVITRQSRVFFSRVFAFSRPNTVRTRVISPIDGRETARKRSDNINTFYVLFAPAREFIRETA